MSIYRGGVIRCWLPSLWVAGNKYISKGPEFIPIYFELSACESLDNHTITIYIYQNQQDAKST